LGRSIRPAPQFPSASGNPETNRSNSATFERGGPPPRAARPHRPGGG
jgi:hypothetical protein